MDAIKATCLSKSLLLENGVVVADLLKTNYMFTATAGTNNTRFSITAQCTATNNNVISNKLDETGISIVNGGLVLANI